MKRKVNMVGTGTLTISLPSKWVKDNGIKKGDEIELSENGSDLSITKGESKKKFFRASINVDNLNKMLINRFFHEFYRQGVEEIVVNYTKDTIPDYKSKTEVSVEEHIKKLIDRFIGMEVVSKKKNKIIIQNLMENVDYVKEEVIVSRVYFLIKEFVDEFISAMDGNFKEFYKKVYDYHDNIVKFIYYYLRILNQSEISEEQKSRLFGLFSVVDITIDEFRHAGEGMSEMKAITPKVKKYVKELFNFFLEELDLVIRKKSSFADLELLIKKRYSILSRFEKEEFNYEEFKVMRACSTILHNINDFSETFIALNREVFLLPDENKLV